MTTPSLDQLIEQFTLNPGCDAFSKPAKKLELITTYLWIQRIVPSVKFQDFIAGYASVADADAVNCKHPETAVSTFLLSGKKAEGQHNWTPEEKLDFAYLYLEMLSGTQATGQSLSLSFSDFVKSDEFRAQYLSGAFGEPVFAKTKAKKQTEPKIKAKVVNHPTTPFEPCVLTLPSGLQHRGKVLNIAPSAGPNGEDLADFQADSGELFAGRVITDLERVEHSGPRHPLGDDGVPKSVLVTQRIYVNKTTTDQIVNYTNKGLAIGTIPVNQPILGVQSQTMMVDSKMTRVNIEMINSHPMYFDARLEQLVDNVWVSVCEMPPRDNIEGEYTFTLESGLVQVSVVTYKERTQ